MVELNNLRVLNDYINQTIDVLLRAQRFGGAVPGLSHSPYATTTAPFGTPVTGLGIGIDPTLAGLSHSPYSHATAYASPFAAAFASPFAATPFASTYPVVDPFVAQRGLSHTSSVGAWQPWSPAFEMARQQQQLAQAIAARQSILEAMWRTGGVI